MNLRISPRAFRTLTNSSLVGAIILAFIPTTYPDALTLTTVGVGFLVFVVLGGFLLRAPHEPALSVDTNEAKIDFIGEVNFLEDVSKAFDTSFETVYADAFEQTSHNWLSLSKEQNLVLKRGATVFLPFPETGGSLKRANWDSEPDEITIGPITVEYSDDETSVHFTGTRKAFSAKEAQIGVFSKGSRARQNLH